MYRHYCLPFLWAYVARAQYGSESSSDPWTVLQVASPTIASNPFQAVTTLCNPGYCPLLNVGATVYEWLGNGSLTSQAFYAGAFASFNTLPGLKSPSNNDIVTAVVLSNQWQGSATITSPTPWVYFDPSNVTAAANCSEHFTPTQTSGLLYSTYPTNYFPRKTAAPTAVKAYIPLDQSQWMSVPDVFLTYFPEYKPYNSNCTLLLESAYATADTTEPVVQLGFEDIVAILEKENCAAADASSIADVALSADATAVPSLLLGC